jgi:predicted Fe-Mo cluster-binding NifX family protein
MMKVVAFITSDGKTIGRHFDRARYFKVITIEDGEITNEQLREKWGPYEEHHENIHMGPQAHDPGESPERYLGMVSPITDCDALIVRGMGYDAYAQIEQGSNIEIFITQIEDINEAAMAYDKGDLVSYPNLLS